MTWRTTAIEAAFRLLSRPVIDGQDDAFIGETIVGPMWSAAEGKKYHNGSAAWCGMFLRWCWTQAGFRPPFNLASPGRVRSLFGNYGKDVNLKPPRFVVAHRDATTSPKVVYEVKQWHADRAQYYNHAGYMRHVYPLAKDGTMEQLRPGDAFCAFQKPGSWLGHVMMVVAHDTDNKRLTIVDGNGVGGSWGPTKPKGDKFTWTARDGVGIRTYDLVKLAATTTAAGIVPSRLDFLPTDFGYFPTLEAAQKALAGMEVE